MNVPIYTLIGYISFKWRVEKDNIDVRLYEAYIIVDLVTKFKIVFHRIIISLYNTILNFGTFYPVYGPLKFMMVLVIIYNCNHWRIQIRLVFFW